MHNIIYYTKCKGLYQKGSATCPIKNEHQWCSAVEPMITIYHTQTDRAELVLLVDTRYVAMRITCAPFYLRPLHFGMFYSYTQQCYNQEVLTVLTLLYNFPPYMLSHRVHTHR